MYGMVHLGLAEMVQEQYGDAKWQEILDSADLSTHTIVSNASYPDEDTYALVGAAVEVLGIDAGELLRLFGQYWVLTTAARYYKTLMDAGGSNMTEFLLNLNSMHQRLSLVFTGYKPPGFSCSNISDSGLDITHETDRPGLTMFVVGLLEGLGERFGTPVEVEILAERGPSTQFDKFRVSW